MKNKTSKYYFKIMGKIQKYFREKRGVYIMSCFPNIQNYRILDVGGSEHFWDELSLNINPSNITLLNVEFEKYETNSKYKKIKYNGNEFPFDKNDFDLVVCNSVLEHLKEDKRQKFAKEILRISKRCFVQTPNFYFFLEPHFILPFIHWLPKSFGWYLSYISPWKILGRPDYTTHYNYFWNTNLLNKSELKALFGNEKILTEDFLFMTKSFYIIKGDKCE